MSLVLKSKEKDFDRFWFNGWTKTAAIWPKYWTTLQNLSLPSASYQLKAVMESDSKMTRMVQEAHDLSQVQKKELLVHWSNLKPKETVLIKKGKRKRKLKA